MSSTASAPSVDTSPPAGSTVHQRLESVLESSAMMAAMTAERFRRLTDLQTQWREESFGRSANSPVTTSSAGIADRSLRLEVAAALRVTENAAGNLLWLAETLVQDYPRVLNSLSDGRVTEQHTRILAETLQYVEESVRTALSDRALQLAEELPVGSFRRALRRLVDATRERTLAARHEQAVIERKVLFEPADDGMAWLSIFGPAVELHAAFERSTAIARALGDVDGETRTRNQLRTDVICDLLIEGNTTVHPQQARGIRANVFVTVPALSLLEQGEGKSPESQAFGEAVRSGVGIYPGAMIEGLGPIPLERARELCGGDSDWTRILTHPESGMVLSVGRTQYRPPVSLRRLVSWRAERCMAPGCGVPASRCEIDHTVAWQDGGHTSLDNLSPLCKGHHTIKHHGNWEIRQVPGSGGALEWTSPVGRRYLTQPTRKLPSFEPSSGPPPDPSAPDLSTSREPLCEKNNVRTPGIEPERRTDAESAMVGRQAPRFELHAGQAVGLEPSFEEHIVSTEREIGSMQNVDFGRPMVPERGLTTVDVLDVTPRIDQTSGPRRLVAGHRTAPSDGISSNESADCRDSKAPESRLWLARLASIRGMKPVEVDPTRDGVTHAPF